MAFGQVSENAQPPHYKIILERALSVGNSYTREFKELLRRRQGLRRLKSEFIFYLRISRYSQVIYFFYHCQNYHETESETRR